MFGFNDETCCLKYLQNQLRSSRQKGKSQMKKCRLKSNSLRLVLDVSTFAWKCSYKRWQMRPSYVSTCVGCLPCMWSDDALIFRNISGPNFGHLLPPQCSAKPINRLTHEVQGSQGNPLLFRDISLLIQPLLNLWRSRNKASVAWHPNICGCFGVRNWGQFQIKQQIKHRGKRFYLFSRR